MRMLNLTVHNWQKFFKKEYSCHVPALKFIRMKHLVQKLQIHFKIYDLCEYVEFGVISWKFDILSITAEVWI